MQWKNWFSNFGYGQFCFVRISIAITIVKWSIKKFQKQSKHNLHFKPSQILIQLLYSTQRIYLLTYKSLVEISTLNILQSFFIYYIIQKWSRSVHASSRYQKEYFDTEYNIICHVQMEKFHSFNWSERHYVLKNNILKCRIDLGPNICCHSGQCMEQFLNMRIILTLCSPLEPQVCSQRGVGMLIKLPSQLFPFLSF